MTHAMHPWEKAYKEKTFRINTLKPSVVVEKISRTLSKRAKIFDIGCGNGRNAIYLAKLGCDVETVDIADLNWLDSLSDKLKSRIKFSKTDINNIKWKKSYYDAVILARVIQYIDPTFLAALIENTSVSLKDSGKLLISYSFSGGIHNRKEIEVPKFIHNIASTETLLKKYFKTVTIFPGSSTISLYVNYIEPIKSYDIICSK